MQVNKKKLLGSIPLGNTGSSEFTYDRLVGILNYLVQNALLLGGFIAVAAIVFYGMQMSLARAEPKKFTEAKDALIKAVIGAILIFGVYTIINTVQGAANTLTN
jgi:type IV secretory pathway VirB2 component (pilin)